MHFFLPRRVWMVEAQLQEKEQYESQLKEFPDESSQKYDNARLLSSANALENRIKTLEADIKARQVLFSKRSRPASVTIRDALLLFTHFCIRP